MHKTQLVHNKIKCIIHNIIVFSLNHVLNICCIFKNVDAGGAKELMAYLVKLQYSLGEVNE